MNSTQLYNVVYYPNPKAIGQVLDYQKPIALAKWLKQGYRTTTHKLGEIKLEKHN